MKHFLPLTFLQYCWYWVANTRVRQTWKLAQRIGMYCEYQGYGSAYCYRGVAPVRLHFTWKEYVNLRRNMGHRMPLIQHSGPNVQGLQPGLVDLNVDDCGAAPNPAIGVQVFHELWDMQGHLSMHLLPFLTMSWGDGGRSLHMGWLVWHVNIRQNRAIRWPLRTPESLVVYCACWVAEEFAWLLWRLHTHGYALAFTYITLAFWVCLAVFAGIWANKQPAAA